MDTNYKKALKRIQRAKEENLKVLSLVDLNLVEIPEEIIQLTNLTWLYLHNNQLTGLPEEISQLTKLTRLSLHNNQLTNLPSGITNFTNLTWLYLHNNQLSRLPKEIAKLKALDRLYLNNNELTNLPKEITKLTKLKELYLSGNKLTSLPKGISNLTNLARLDLSNNQITNLPKEIIKLTKLGWLFLQNNQLTNLPKGIDKLSNLIKLHLEDNELTSLPKEIALVQNLTELFLKGNQFEFGPEIFKLSPTEQIREIFRWQEAKEANLLRPIHEAKVIFIGESNYGKTHLIEFLQKGEIERKITTTHGIERSRLQTPHEDKFIRLNIWDLGGQEFMRSTHQFFFSERTLYVLVTLARKERNELNHWLKLASQLGNNAPVLVVINKIDLDSHDLDRKSLQRDYPNIIGFVRTCIKDNDENKAEETIYNLKKAINDIVCNEELMPSIFEKRRPEWFTVKEQLEKLEEEGVDFISYQKYEELDHIKELPKDERKSNLKLLSILGAVVSFVDDPRLMDTNVINPQWIMDGVYAIINDPTIKDLNKGRFEIQDLNAILDHDRFPENRHVFLLDLLEKFGLCYAVSGNKNVYYIPDLFEDIEPDFEWDSNEAMHFRYNYDDFPPDAFMTRFIVDMHEDIRDNIRWRSGVLISNGTCTAKVFQAFRKNYIQIEIIGNTMKRPRYLYSIRQTFRRLHAPFPEMKIKQEVFYKEFWLDYLALVKLEDKNKPYYHTELEEDIPIKEILDGYSASPNRKADILTEMAQGVNDIKNLVTKNNKLLDFGLTQNTAIKYPNIFSLKPARQLINAESNLHSPYNLQLYCSHPGCLHPVGDAFEIKILKEWVQKLAPYYNSIVKGLKLAAPAIRPAAYQILGPAAYAPNNLSLKGTQDYIGKLKEIGDGPKLRAYEPRAATEAEMQIIKQIMDEADPNKEWMQYLQKVILVDKVIWVCPQHGEEY